MDSWVTVLLNDLTNCEGVRLVATQDIFMSKYIDDVI